MESLFGSASYLPPDCFFEEGIENQQPSMPVSQPPVFSSSLIQAPSAQNSSSESSGTVLGSAVSFLQGGPDSDVLIGDASDNTIEGAGGNDILEGLAGDDTLNGGSDNDRISGGAGNNMLNGGTGEDTVTFADTRGDVTVDLTRQGQPQETGDGIDTLTNFSNIEGSEVGNDRLEGDNNDNTLVGLGGNDTIEGGLGDDRLTGVGGDDVLRGGAGADTFSFTTANGQISLGNDVITDFDPREDKLDVATTFASLNEVLGAASQVGADTLISFGDSGSVRLQNVAVGDVVTPAVIEGAAPAFA